MYIIKKHYEATDSNPNFAGEVKDYYEGKSGHQLIQPLVRWEIEEYGYKTIAAAARGLKAVQGLCDWETSKGFWKVSAELVEM